MLIDQLPLTPPTSVQAQTSNTIHSYLIKTVSADIFVPVVSTYCLMTQQTTFGASKCCTAVDNLMMLKLSRLMCI